MSSDAFGTEGLILPIIVNGGVQPEVTQSLADAINKLTAAAEALGNVGKKSEETKEKLSLLQRIENSLNTSFVETKAAIDLAVMAYHEMISIIDGVAALTAEQQQLSASSERLNLDFNQAADGAGRFVDETEAMAAASRLAEAGLHLTQEELNQLTARAAIASQRLGVDTTTAFNMLTTAIESGSARALRPFGEDMLRLAGSTHSMEERLGAFVTTTHDMARATDDASTSMQRLRDSVGDAEREMASSFSAEIERLHTITERTSALSTQTDNSVHQLRALGQTAALVVTGVLNGIGAVVGGVALGIAGTVGMARIAIADINALRRGESVSAAHATAVREHFGRDSTAQSIMDFLENRANALNALADDEGAGRGSVRGLIAGARMPGAPAAASNDMVFGESQAEADDAYRAAHRRQNAGGRRRQPRAPFTRNEQEPWSDQVSELFDRAFGRQERPTADQLMARTGAGVLTENLASGTRVGSERDEAEQEQRKRQERAAQEAEMRESFATRMSESLRRYADTARHTRDLVVGSFEDMTAAVGKHIEAVVMGRESIGDALQGMVADALAAVAKRASVSAAEELVASIASLAIGDFRGAGLHGAAAVGYTAVAALAGAASTAVAPTAPAAGASARAPERAASPSAGGKSAGEGQVVNVYFGGPVIGPGGSRQAARDIAAILNDGARQGGVRLTPNLLPVMP